MKTTDSNLVNRNERRKLKTKENIRKAAIESFLELGYLNSNVQDIMRRADMGYGTFYQYYRSKQDVIVELATEAWEMIKNDYVIPPVTETSLYKRTVSRLELVFRTYSKHRDVIRILMDCHTMDEELHRVWTQLMEEPYTRLKKDLTWSMKRGLCRDVDLNIAIVSVYGMVHAVGNHIIQNNLIEQEIEKIIKDVGLLFEKAVFAVEHIPHYYLIKSEIKSVELH
ncbi:hypothetical protein JCM15765_45570 [Paradesulfitobacterium aromaticivorans]